MGAGGATIDGSGTYTMTSHRRFTFEYTISFTIPNFGTITSTPISGDGHLSRDRNAVSLGITDPQPRQVLRDGAPFFDQVCTWAVTAHR